MPRTAMTNRAMSEDQVAEHFWSKVNKDGPVPAHRPELGPCWIWTDYCKKNGYGQCYVNRRPRYAHRLSYELANAPYDSSLKVLHHCDNPPCVRPSHLFLGTLLDNVQDAVSKGRMHPGEANGAAKLTNDQVAAVRELAPTLQSLSKPQRETLAQSLGITMNHLTEIITRRKWKAV